MTDFSLRFGVPSDAPRLLELEKTYFPAVAGTYHAGYLFESPEMSRAALTEEIATAVKAFNIVAEVEGEVVGLAAATPFTMPGTGQVAPASSVLRYLVVDPAYRRSGIARALVAEVENRARAARQNIMVAHIPTDEEEFYRAIDWHVAPEGYGYAWIPFVRDLHADVGDAHVGFPLMAAKILRPKAIRRAFDFPIVNNRPTLDAAAELGRLIDAHEIDITDLEEDTQWMVTEARKGAVPKAVLDLFGS